MRVSFSDEQARRTLGFCLPELLFHNREFSESVSLEIIMYLCPQITKTKFDYGGYINRAQYLRGNRLAASLVEELLTSFNSFVTQMKAMAGRGTDKRLGEWLDNQDVCQILNISPRTLQTLRQNGALAYSQIEHKTYYKPEDVERIIPLVEVRKKDTHSYGRIQRKGGGI